MKQLLIIASFFISITANATTYYVSTTGSDSNSGLTEVLPWQTIDKVNSFSGSQSPANDVKNVTKMIDSLQGIIRVQYITQLKDTTKK